MQTISGIRSRNLNDLNSYYQYTTTKQRSRTELADGSLVPGQQFEYQFDDIGNRRETKEGGDESGASLRSASYTPNLLNQYDARTVPGAVDVIGMADPATTVQVNGQSAYRRGEYFQKAVTVANGGNPGNPVYQAVNVLAGADRSSGRVFVPQAAEAFTYDDDGNLTGDGRWNYTWNAENRLVQVESKSTTPKVSRKSVKFEYDWQGRRIRKQVYPAVYRNYALAANGGILVSYTSQYADSCAVAKTMDGNTGGVGYSWCSAANPGPQDLVYRINNGQPAAVGKMVLYNFGEENIYYSRDFELYASLTNQNWTLVRSGKLAATTGLQSFQFDEVEAVYLKLVITSGYNSCYWELSEFQILGVTGIAESPSEDARFLNDGWNCIAELDEQLAVVKSHAWGLDISGTLQGAGGVGGLLLVHRVFPRLRWQRQRHCLHRLQHRREKRRL